MSEISTPVTGPEHSHSTAHRPLVIAHRGACAVFAENTRAAFLRALAEGADGVEVDVRLTRDRHLVCWHDATLERTSNGSGPVGDHTLVQLRRLDVHTWKGVPLPGEYGTDSVQLLTLPELVELLVDAGRPLKLALELKHPSPFGHELEERALSVLLASGWDPQTSQIGQVEVSFMSFSAGSMQYLAPAVRAEHLCQLVSVVPDEPVAAQFGLEPLGRSALRAALCQALADAEHLIWQGRTSIAGPSVQYVRRHLAEVKAWIAAGRTLRAWTADRPEDVELLRSVGVQEITTNLPGPVRAQLGGRAAVPEHAVR